MAARLPMELWAYVATFVPFGDLLPTFWALRRAGALPATHTTPSQSLLQFCALHRGDAQERETRRAFDPRLKAALYEWFEPAVVDYSVELCRGHADAVLDHLMRAHSVTALDIV